jgi:hypothetical protein
MLAGHNFSSALSAAWTRLMLAIIEQKHTLTCVLLPRVRVLQVLILSGHDFSSSLPAAWTRLQQLRVLDISRNSLTGSLPSWYVSMRQLAVLKVHGNKLERAADDAPEFYEALLGPSSKLQCLSVADNAEVLVDAATATRLAAKARQRTPAVPLQINKPSSSLCDPAAYKDGGEGTLHG